MPSKVCARNRSTAHPPEPVRATRTSRFARSPTRRPEQRPESLPTPGGSTLPCPWLSSIARSRDAGYLARSRRARVRILALNFISRAVRAGDRTRAPAASHYRATTSKRDLRLAFHPRPRDPAGRAWRIVKVQPVCPFDRGNTPANVHRSAQRPREAIKASRGRSTPSWLKTTKMARGQRRPAHAPSQSSSPNATVGAPGLEPGTSALSGPRSNHLSYAPPRLITIGGG